MPQVLVRYYAGAARAAGLTEESCRAETVAEVVATLERRHGPDLRRVLQVSSFLLDGVVVSDRGQPLPDGSELHVLPPFAGG